MKHSSSRAQRACALLLCGWTAANAAGERSLSLHDVISLTEQHNPELAVFADEQESSRQQAAILAQQPAFTVAVQLENFAGTSALAAARSLETTLQLSQVIERGSKAQRRYEQGRRQLEQLVAEQRARRADILAEVARRFVHVLADQEALKAAERTTRLAEQTREAVRRRVDAGAASEVLLGRAQIALSRSRVIQEHAEHELASSRVALAVMWGESEAQVFQVEGELFEFPPPQSLQAYLERLDTNPELLDLATQAKLLQSRERVAESQGFADITVSAGVRRLEGMDDHALVAGFAIPLGAAKRARPQLLALAAQRRQLEHSTRSLRLQLRARLFSLYQELLHEQGQAQALQMAIRPQALAVLETIAAGFRAGRYSLLELAEARQELLKIEQDAIHAAAQFHTNLIDIQRITGLGLGSM